MALRMIVTEGDEILRKRSKPVKEFGERTRALLDDMWETMRAADGVGLAAPQLGVLRRAVVIDVTAPERGEGEEQSGAPSDARAASDAADAAPSEAAERAPDPGLPVNAPGGVLYELLNPEIIASEGESREREGCLSVPGLSGFVRRPERVTVRAFDRDGSELVIEGEGLLARAICHEIDHLEGVLFTDMAEEVTSAEEARDESGRRTEDG